MSSHGRTNGTASRLKGFTVTELVIALFVTALVILGVIAAGFTQMKQYRAQRDYMEIRQNLRVAANMISRDVRMAGYGLTVTLNNVDDWITWVSGVTNTLDFRTINTNSSPSLLIAGAMGETTATLSTSASSNSTTLSLASGDGASFDTGNRKVFYLGRRELARVVSVSGDTLTVSTHPTINGRGITMDYPAGSILELIEVIEYRTEGSTTSYPYRPYLIRDNHRGVLTNKLQQLVSMGIETLGVTLTNDLATINLTGVREFTEHGYTHPVKNDGYRRDTMTVTAEARNLWSIL